MTCARRHPNPRSNRGLAAVAGMMIAGGFALPGLSTGAATSAGAHEAPDVETRVEQRVGSLLRSTVETGGNSAAVLVLVRDGRIRIAEGFGYEDPGRRNPITAAESRFPLNSVGKMFVAVALAQLKSQGRIASYDDPINRYLRSYRLPDNAGQPITLSELATHTAGIDENVFATDSALPETGQPTAADYQAHEPRYFIEPNRVASYSSIGIDFLALAVADVSQMPFSAYVETQILNPLEMTRTLAQYPRGPMAHVVQSFQPDNPGKVTPWLYKKPFTFPDGGALSTGEDMGRFLVALLDREGGRSAITPSMQDDLFRVRQHTVADAAYALIFEVTHIGSKLVAYHSGGGNGSRCFLAVVPADGTGLFTCLTFQPPPWLTRRATLQFTDVIAQVFASLGSGGESSAQPAWNDAWNAYLGEYVWLDRIHFGIGRLPSVLHAWSVRVQRGTDGLKIGGIDGFAEISPGCFGKQGLVETYRFYHLPGFPHPLLSSSLDATPFELPNFQESPHVMKPLLAALLAIAATGLMWPLWPGLRGTALATRAAPVGFGLCLLGCAGVMYAFHAFGARYHVGIGWQIVLMRICGFLAAPMAFVLTGTVLLVWRQPGGAGLLARAHLGLLAAAAWLAVAALVSIGVIGFITR